MPRRSSGSSRLFYRIVDVRNDARTVEGTGMERSRGSWIHSGSARTLIVPEIVRSSNNGGGKMFPRMGAYIETVPMIVRAHGRAGIFCISFTQDGESRVGTGFLQAAQHVLTLWKDIEGLAAFVEANSEERTITIVSTIEAEKCAELVRCFETNGWCYELFCLPLTSSVNVADLLAHLLFTCRIDGLRRESDGCKIQLSRYISGERS